MMMLTAPRDKEEIFKLIEFQSYYTFDIKGFNKRCTSVPDRLYSKSKEKMKHPYLFQYKLSYKNETGTNHHGLVSTSV